MRPLEQRDMVKGHITRPDDAYDCPRCDGTGTDPEEHSVRVEPGAPSMDVEINCNLCAVFWKYDSRARTWVHPDEFEAYADEWGLCSSCAQAEPMYGFRQCGPCSDEERADVAFHAWNEER